MKCLADYIKPFLAILIVICTFSYFFVITFSNVKADPQIIIAIVAAMSQVLSYYFGASTGSAKKDETINNLIEQKK